MLGMHNATHLPPSEITSKSNFRFGRYKTLAALTLRPTRAGRHPPLAHPVSRPHPPPSARLIDSPYAGPLWAPASAAKMGSHDGVVSGLHRTRREVGSKRNSELGSPTSHPRVSSSLSLTSLAACCQLLSPALLSPSNHTLRFQFEAVKYPDTLWVFK
jgi:hypothetical protein